MKVGDYVRTDNGLFTKIKAICEQKWEEPKCVYARILCEDNEIYEYPKHIKSSTNIIDLIEVGDYVNGFIVCDSSWGRVIIAATEDIWEMNSIKDEFRNNDLFVSKVYKLEDIEIKSIVTKEQFEKMEYKIGD